MTDKETLMREGYREMAGEQAEWGAMVLPAAREIWLGWETEDLPSALLNNNRQDTPQKEKGNESDNGY